MLVLSRKLGESIIVELPDKQVIKISLLKRQTRTQYKVGVECNKEFQIYREEIYGTKA